MEFQNNKVFREAHDHFVASLSPKDRDLYSRCDSAQEFLAEVQKFEAVSGNRLRGRGLIARIKSFSDRLEPYFDAIGIIVQARPEYAAFVWGTVRMVLQLASNFISFFEKLASTLEELAAQFPQYDLIAGLCEKLGPDAFSDRVKCSLREAYVDLFRFFQSVARIFVKKDGKQKRTPLIATDLFWRPFDLRFEDLLKQLEFHARIARTELDLANIYAGIEERSKSCAERDAIAAERVEAEIERKAAAQERAVSAEERLAEEKERYQAALERSLASDAREKAKRQESFVNLKWRVQRDEYHGMI